MNRTTVAPNPRFPLDIEQVALALSVAADVERHHNDREVYVNYAHHEAVVLTFDPAKPSGNGWYVTAIQWDASGGINADCELTRDYVSAERAILVTLLFLAAERDQNARDEAALS